MNMKRLYECKVGEVVKTSRNSEALTVKAFEAGEVLLTDREGDVYHAHPTCAVWVGEAVPA